MLLRSKKWMNVFWIGLIVTVAGGMIGVLVFNDQLLTARIQLVGVLLCMVAAVWDDINIQKELENK